MVFFSFAFAGAKTPLQRFRWLIKAPPPLRLHCKQCNPPRSLPTLCYSSRAAFVSVVSAFRVHFLTFIDNYPISQIASSHACSLFGRALAVSVSVVSFGFSGAKL